VVQDGEFKAYSEVRYIYIVAFPNVISRYAPCSFISPPLSMPPKAESSNQVSHTDLLYLLLEGGRNANPVSIDAYGGV
jgi:hypothetical protein